MKNPKTTKFKEFLKQGGYTVYDNGWPDYLAEDQEGNKFFVEFKSKNDKLHNNQPLLLNKLADLGLNVLVVSEGLLKDVSKLNYVNDPVYEIVTTTKTIEKITPEVKVLPSKKISDVKDYEKTIFKNSLAKNNNNLTKTAIDLGVTVRSLRYKKDKYKL
jgi:hypothetical protein